MTWYHSVSLEDLVFCIAEYFDLASPAIARHHLLVSAISNAIGVEAGLPGNELRSVTLAGALHDIGAFSLRERIDLLAFEVEKPHEHSQYGMLLLGDFSPLRDEAGLILHHHVRHDEAPEGVFEGMRVKRGSSILHLADRVAILVDREREILGQAAGIRRVIADQSRKMFRPDLVEAFLALSSDDSFWLGISAEDLESSLRQRLAPRECPLSNADLLALGEITTSIIDYKSAFTATHSRGVAATASTLAGLSGFDENGCRTMLFAGLLHDIGKLAIPAEIIERPASLSDDETAKIQSHAYHTWKAFERFRGMDEARSWAAHHHEHLDGSGYPFHLSGGELSPGSRILAVADVYTAMTEDRPYRPGMPSGQAINLMNGLVRQHNLDGDAVSVLAANAFGRRPVPPVGSGQGLGRLLHPLLPDVNRSAVRARRTGDGSGPETGAIAAAS